MTVFFTSASKPHQIGIHAPVCSDHLAIDDSGDLQRLMGAFCWSSPLADAVI